MEYLDGVPLSRAATEMRRRGIELGSPEAELFGRRESPRSLRSFFEKGEKEGNKNLRLLSSSARDSSLRGAGLLRALSDGFATQMLRGDGLFHADPYMRQRPNDSIYLGFPLVFERG